MDTVRLETVDSTNLEARRRHQAGEAGPLWILAAEQTAGRGRLGRTWVSKPGNLYATLIWPTAAPPQALAQLSFVAAIAVHETASDFATPSRISLKWPNDCLLDGAKFCGILIEALNAGTVAIGVGINVGHSPEGLPYKVAALAGNVDSIFEKLALTLSYYLGMWKDAEGFPAIREAWMVRCNTIGQPITVDGEAGTFNSVAPDGALAFTASNGHTRLVYAGDVRVEYQPQP